MLGVPQSAPDVPQMPLRSRRASPDPAVALPFRGSRRNARSPADSRNGRWFRAILWFQ